MVAEALIGDAAVDVVDAGLLSVDDPRRKLWLSGSRTGLVATSLQKWFEAGKLKKWKLRFTEGRWWAQVWLTRWLTEFRGYVKPDQQQFENAEARGDIGTMNGMKAMFALRIKLRKVVEDESKIVRSEGINRLGPVVGSPEGFAARKRTRLS